MEMKQELDGASKVDRVNNKILLQSKHPMKKIISACKNKQVEFIRRDCTREVIKKCIEMCCAPMVPYEKWRYNHKSLEFSTIVDIADEAFGLLVLENNVNEWMSFAIHGKEDDKKGTLSRYTGKATKEDGTKRGWSLEGKRRFNEIYDEIKVERLTAKSREVEVWMKDEWNKENDKEDAASGSGGNDDDAATEKIKQEEESFVPRNGFDD